MGGGSSAAKQPALGMLLHAAGTLQDGMLASQNLPGLRAVLAAKLGAMRGVSSRLPIFPVERLVLFSSVASLLGTTGQANYAAANAGLDAWAADAGSSGLWAVSLQWAAWASSGRSPSHCHSLSLRGAWDWASAYPYSFFWDLVWHDLAA